MPTDAAVVFNPVSFAAGGQIFAGSKSFSPVPTIAEINASLNYNQIVGLVNRRTSQLGVGTAQPYVNPGDKITTALLTNLTVQINALRAARGLAAITFTISSKPTASLWTALRTAMAFAGTYVRANSNVSDGNSGALAEWRRIDLPYGTAYTAEAMLWTAGNSGAVVGKLPTGVGAPAHRSARQRELKSFPLDLIGAGMTGFTAGVSIYITSYVETLEPCILQMWASNTDDSFGTAGAAPTGPASNGDNLNNLIGSFSAGATGQQTMAIPNAQILARAGIGKHLSIILGQANELAGTGLDAGTSGKSFANLLSPAAAPYFTSVLTIDWGF